MCVCVRARARACAGWPMRARACSGRGERSLFYCSHELAFTRGLFNVKVNSEHYKLILLALFGVFFFFFLRQIT